MVMHCGHYSLNVQLPVNSDYRGPDNRGSILYSLVSENPNVSLYIPIYPHEKSIIKPRINVAVKSV